MVHVLPAALKATVPDQRSPGTCLGRGGTGTLVWLSEALGPRWPWGETVPGIPSVDFSERGTPQPSKPGKTTCIPQCPQHPRSPPHAVDLGVPYPGVLATEGEASLSHPGTPSPGTRLLQGQVWLQHVCLHFNPDPRSESTILTQQAWAPSLGERGCPWSPASRAQWCLSTWLSPVTVLCPAGS